MRRNINMVCDRDGQSKFIQLMYNAILLSLYSLGPYPARLSRLYYTNIVRVYLLARVDRLKETVKLSSSIGGLANK